MCDIFPMHEKLNKGRHLLFYQEFVCLFKKDLSFSRGNFVFYSNIFFSDLLIAFGILI